MPELNRTQCIACGLCARVCPAAVITMEEGAPVIHHQRQCMECWHCAAICPRQAIRQDGLDLYPPIPDREPERLVTMRRSTRHFKNDPPEKETIARALETAAWAPTSKNERTYGWTVVYGRNHVLELLNLILDWCKDEPRFKVLTKLVTGFRDPVTCGAPCVLLVHNTETGTSPETDCVIAAATAELLLNAAGLGTCWGGYLRRAAAACPKAKEYLGIPEGHNVYAALLTGIRDNEPYRSIPRRPRPDIQWK